ncbi:MAG: GAF domain-containing protein [Myxococcales bacterium]
MDAKDIAGLPWPVLLVASNGAIAASSSVEGVLGFMPTDQVGLENRIDVALPPGSVPGEVQLPWRRHDVPFDEPQVWHDRIAGRWHPLRVRAAQVPGGLLLSLDVSDEAALPVERAERALKAIQKSLVKGSATLPLRRLLHMLVELACELTGARYGAMGVMARDASRLKDFIYVGLTEEQARRIGHLPEGKGLLGAVIREGGTVNVERISADRRSYGFPAHHPPMSSFLGVPLRIGERVFGNFYVTEKQGAPAFTEADARQLERFSEQAALLVAFAEQAEDEQRRLFRALVEHAPYGLVFFPGSDAAPFGNPSAERMLGRVDLPADSPNRTYCLLRPDDTPFPEAEEPELRARSGETFVNVEALVRRQGASRIPMLLSAAPVVTEAGDLLGAVVVYQDISTLKALERLREEFAAIVAHDMRAPVNSVLLQVEALMRRATGDAAWVPVAALKSMRSSGELLSHLISDLMDASRLDSSTLPVDRQVFDASEEARALLLRLRNAFGDRRVESRLSGGP